MEENIKFVKAAVLEALILNGYASGSAVAWVMYQKFANAMPLYRQEQDWHQLGVDFTRATLANWIIYCADNYLKPMYDYLHRQLLHMKESVTGFLSGSFSTCIRISSAIRYFL